MGSVLCPEFEAKQHRRQLDKKKKWLETKRGQKWLNSRSTQRYMRKRREKLEEGANLRQQQEQDTSKGERVWFSRYVENGRLRHWVLLTHGTKYELRRADNVQRPRGDGDQARFTYDIKPFTIDQEQRASYMAEWKIPEQDGYFVCLIGWTRKSKEEVDAACQAVLAQFGEYSLLWNNCQDFLRLLASQVLIAKAADYQWFADNTKTRYHKDTLLTPPPLEMLVKMERRAAQSHSQHMHHMNHVNHMHHIDNNLNIQLQNQISMQIQTQLQNQITMQMTQQQMMGPGGMGGGGMGA